MRGLLPKLELGFNLQALEDEEAAFRAVGRRKAVGHAKSPGQNASGDTMLDEVG